MKIGKTLSTAAMATIVVGAYAQQDSQQRIRVVVDGAAIHFKDQQPTKTNDRVLVPLRGIFERLGAHVRWDPTTQTVTAEKGDKTVTLAIGQLDASVDGHSVHLDVPATLVGGSTMVPLRFVSEALGASVTWNDQEQEADITPATEEPRREHPVAPPQRIKQQSRPMAIARMDTIQADTVLPLTLNNRLSSSNAAVGDQFSATLSTFGKPRYLDLPTGTLVYGTVHYVRARQGNEPGIIELSFDHLTTPAGHTYPVDGRLIGLETSNVSRGSNGALIARSTERNDRVLFTGYGAGAGLIVGLATKRPVEDTAIGEMLGSAVGSTRRAQQTRNVELVPGTKFGLRLIQPLTLPYDIR